MVNGCYEGCRPGKDHTSAGTVKQCFGGVMLCNCGTSYNMQLRTCIASYVNTDLSVQVPWYKTWNFKLRTVSISNFDYIFTTNMTISSTSWVGDFHFRC